MSASRFKAILEHLAASTINEIKKLLGVVSPGVRKGLKEVAYNLLKGRVPLAKSALENLKKYKTQIRDLAKRGLSKCRRKNTKWCRAIKLMLQSCLEVIKEL